MKILRDVFKFELQNEKFTAKKFFIWLIVFYLFAFHVIWSNCIWTISKLVQKFSELNMHEKGNITRLKTKLENSCVL